VDLVNLADQWRMLTVSFWGGDRRGRDEVEMPVALPARLHGEAGVDRAKEEIRYNGLQVWCRCWPQ
jgi:hypothetical protein